MNKLLKCFLGFLFIVNGNIYAEVVWKIGTNNNSSAEFALGPSDYKNFLSNHLWDDEKQQFIPHIYLEGSPFPDDFDESAIYYFGGTAVAIEAGLLSKEEIKTSLNEMISRVEQAGAASIGLTLYPVYPDGFFQNPGMKAYSYQNGGDWTWFGARMVQQLVATGFLSEAYEQLLPMTERVLENKGFYEWYTVNNEPRGSGTFRGSAGVLYTAITNLEKSVNK